MQAESFYRLRPARAGQQSASCRVEAVEAFEAIASMTCAAIEPACTRFPSLSIVRIWYRRWNSLVRSVISVRRSQLSASIASRMAV